MLWDAIRSYVQLATGVTEATTDKAKEVAQGLLSAVGITNSNEVAAQVSGMADEILNAARDQRDSFVNLVRAEVTTVIDSSGVAKAADVDALTSRLTQLAVEVEALVSSLPGGSLTPAGIRTRRRAEATDGHAESTDGHAEQPGEAVGPGATDQAPSTASAPARKRAARKAAPAKKSAPAPRARAAGTRKTAAASTSTSADEGTTPRRSARKSASPEEGSSPRKTARKSASADKATAPPRKTTAKRTSPRKSAPAKQSQVPLVEGSDSQQAQVPASDNG